MKAFRFSRGCIFALLFTAMAATHGVAAQQLLVIGDSLSKEYEIEFPILFPSHREAWDSRNWAEILHQERNPWFDLGKFSVWPDVRIAGHRHNWAFPGAKAAEIRARLASKSWYDKIWQAELRSQIKSAAERIVIFAGGNDVDDYYDKLYNGSSPTKYITKTRDDVMYLVNYVRGVRSSVPIVLVAVPHVGCTPDVKAGFPTDPVKTGRVTAALDSLNSQLASFARSKKIGFASGVYDFTKSLISGTLTLGGVELVNAADADARPVYLFSGDGFHPNTPAQAKIAQIILDAFRAKYRSPVIPALSDAEILRDVLTD